MSRRVKKLPSIAALIQRVTCHTTATLTGANPAMQALARHGAKAVGPVLRAMRGPTPPGQHARDMVEALAAVLTAIAKRDAAPLIHVLERDGAPADPEMMLLVGALGAGRKAQVLQPLVLALKHPSAVVRWSAALSLVQLRSKKAVAPLTAALRDGSPMVQGTVVEAMLRSEFYRTPAAAPALQRIVRNRRTKKQWPGLWRNANALLATFPSPGQSATR